MSANPNSPGAEALKAAAEVVKYLTALGTGAIVFSAGLLNEKIFLLTSAKWFIFFAWCCLAISVLGGLLAGMRIPVQLSEQNYDLEDRYLKYPGMAQQVAFFVGVLLLGIALTILLTTSGEQKSSEESAPVAHPSPNLQRRQQFKLLQSRSPRALPKAAKRLLANEAFVGAAALAQTVAINRRRAPLTSPLFEKVSDPRT